jgi:hypothetical protein
MRNWKITDTYGNVAIWGKDRRGGKEERLKQKE